MSNIDETKKIEDEAFYILYTTIAIIAIIIFIWLMVNILNEDIQVLETLSDNEETAEK
jgi:ABC-type phosphate transport system permease subunit